MKIIILFVVLFITTNINANETKDKVIKRGALNCGVSQGNPRFSSSNEKNEWSYNIIKQVGNYEESFERNIGSKSPFNIDRGLNKLWNKGGILYVPPLR